ncbi:MAG: ribosome biogenesis GTPase Der [Salinisphaera sp.]|nr:ribosome biogenesis GTPase Der [Salinisphaera sp.]
MQAALPVVVLVGRPNVGKSTLFNRLTRTRDALVADLPGVTRDRQYGYARMGARMVLVVDTGGIGVDDAAIDALAARQTQMALAEADAVVLVLDGLTGPLPDDVAIAKRLRGLPIPIHAVVNKTEGRDPDAAVAEFHGLGLGAPLAVSAQHGDRIPRLAARLLEGLPGDHGPAPPSSELRMAILGRPNAGKSTLTNRLLGESRMLCADAPGTTRDAVSSRFLFDDRSYEVVDTAGIRRRARVHDDLERLSVVKAMQAAEAADVVVLLVDARVGPGAGELRLLHLILERGRALVLAVNKWDGLDHGQRAQVREELHRRLSHLVWLRPCFLSALHGSGLRELMVAVRSAHAAAGRELPTPELTRVLEQAVAAHAPPLVHGRRIKLRFAHQGGRHPPRIVIHGNQTRHVPGGYRRYLTGRFRAAFALNGTPIELVFKTARNPYAEAGQTRPEKGKRKEKIIRKGRKGK